MPIESVAVIVTGPPPETRSIYVSPIVVSSTDNELYIFTEMYSIVLQAFT